MCPEIIDDDEILVRFVFENFQCKNKILRPLKVFKPNYGDKGTSVIRLKHSDFNECKKFAKLQENQSQKKLFSGFVLISVKTILDLGLKIEEEKVEGIEGHANIIFDFILEKGKPSTEAQNDIYKSLCDKRIDFLPDPKPSSNEWD